MKTDVPELNQKVVMSFQTLINMASVGATGQMEIQMGGEKPCKVRVIVCPAKAGIRQKSKDGIQRVITVPENLGEVKTI